MADFDDPRTLGLLAAGLAMLSSKGNAGQALGQGGLLGLQAMQGAKQSRSEEEDRKARREMQQLQMEHLRSQMNNETRVQTGLLNAAQNAYEPGPQAPVPMGPPDASGSTGTYATQGAFNPDKYLKAAIPFMSPEKVLDVSMRKQESPWAKVNPKDYTVESLRTFAKSQNPADLVPIDAQTVGKVNPADFTAASVKAFVDGGSKDYSVLVPLDKRNINNVSVPVNLAPKAFWQDFGKGQSDALLAGHKAAQQAAETLQTINQARTQIAGGAYQGGMADIKLNAVNTLKGMGFQVDDKTLANTAALKSAMGQFLLQHAKALGSNPSNADAARIDKIVGTIDTDPGALNKALDFMEQMARRSVRTFNTQYKQAMSQQGAFSAYDMTIPEPPPFELPQQSTTAPKRLRYNPSTGRVE
jgi:hypothetical protein